MEDAQGAAVSNCRPFNERRLSAADLLIKRQLETAAPLKKPPSPSPRSSTGKGNGNFSINRVWRLLHYAAARLTERLDLRYRYGARSSASANREKDYGPVVPIWLLCWNCWTCVTVRVPGPAQAAAVLGKNVFMHWAVRRLPLPSSHPKYQFRLMV